MYRPSNHTLVFSCPAMGETAERLIERSPSRFRRGEIKWGRFPDRTPNVLIKDIGAIRDRDVIFMAAFEGQGNYFDQYATMYEIVARAHPRTFTIFLPYYPTATMERPSPHGIVVTAEALARMLGSLPTARRSLTELIVLDPHTETMRGFFNPDAIRVMFGSFMDEIVARIVSPQRNNWNSIPKTIVFPDKGARDRFERYFTAFDRVVCEKDRGTSGKERNVHIIEGDPAGKACIVIDDLVQTGGTLINCAKALRKAGATDVQAAITHPVFPSESWKLFTPELFSMIYTTTSCPTSARAIAELPNFTVVNASDLLFSYLP